MPSSARDKDATWHSPGALCRERGWTPARLVYELQNGLPYRRIPPRDDDPPIDWADPEALRTLDLERGEVSVPEGEAVRDFGSVIVFGTGYCVVAFEVALPTDASPVAAPTPPVAAPTSPRKNVSAAERERCFREIMAERPNNPPDEEWMLAEMKKRLGASPGREEVRALWKSIAQAWKNPRGAPPRKKISAKNSAE